jgi:molybdopterin molybdotransferase
MPMWDNSAMDGFAVRAADAAAGVVLKVSGYIPAGETAQSPLSSSCAIRIMTGAPIPAGADAVVPVEETIEEGETVRCTEQVLCGQHIRYKGEDVKTGDTIVSAGTVINVARTSMLAALGKAMVAVYRQPTVAIVSTGDELVELGEMPAAGQIINSNTLALAAAVREAGGIPLIIGIARDTRESHREKLAEGLKADVLVTSAGVSAGDRDLVREVLAELGVQQLFWKIDIKPGRPTAFGTKDGKPVFSLPGNPVSAMLTFEQFVKPSLLKISGQQQVIAPLVKAVLMEDVTKKPGRLHFLRVRLTQADGRYLATVSGDQNTGILKTLVKANAIAFLPADQEFFAKGEELDVQILDYSFAMSAPEQKG